MRTPVFDNGKQVVPHLARRCPRFVWSDRDPRDVVRPALEPVVVLDGNADDASDHLHGVPGRDITNEIGSPERRDVVEHAADRRRNQLVLPLREGRRPERLGDELAVVAVFIAVHADERLAHDRPDHLVMDRGGERLRVADDGLTVGVPEHHERPATGNHRIGRLEHGRLVPRSAPHCVWL